MSDDEALRKWYESGGKPQSDLEQAMLDFAHEAISAIPLCDEEGNDIDEEEVAGDPQRDQRVEADREADRVPRPDVGSA